MSVRIAVGGDAGEAVTRVVPRLVDERIASGVAAQDPALWGPAAESESAARLGWTEAVANSRPLVAEIVALRQDLAAMGVDRVVLCATGGSSLAAQVIAATQGVPLTVLDSADPDTVRRVVDERLEATVAVVASKSGTTVETDGHRRSFEQAFRDAGIDPARRIVVVTDPGTPLDADARRAGYRVFAGDPAVGGRWSALTAFGLVPSGLAGADIAELLDEAESELLDLAVDQAQNNGLVLAAAIAGTNPRRDKLVIVADGTHLVGFGEWIEHLVAESTGKQGTGLLPVVVEVGAPELDARLPDVQIVRLVDEATDDRHDEKARAGELLLSGTLGELFLVWEYAVAIAGRLIGVNPFDQPEVDAAEVSLREALSSRTQRDEPAPMTADEALAAIADPAEEGGYLGVLVYADPAEHARLRALRDLLARRTGRPVTFGWGSRHLHSTGQYHLGGPDDGVFLMISTVHGEDLPVPGRAYGYADLLRAQRLTDAAELVARGRRVLHVHLEDDAALESLLTAAAP